MKAKIISLNKSEIRQTKNVVEKISLNESKKILNVGGNNYSDEQVELIRDSLHNLAEINYEYYLEWRLKQEIEENKREGKIESEKNKEQNNIIQLKTSNNDETQSNSLCEGKYRRAS